MRENWTIKGNGFIELIVLNEKYKKTAQGCRARQKVSLKEKHLSSKYKFHGIGIAVVGGAGEAHHSNYWGSVYSACLSTFLFRQALAILYFPPLLKMGAQICFGSELCTMPQADPSRVR